MNILKSGRRLEKKTKRKKGKVGEFEENLVSEEFFPKIDGKT